MYDGKFIFKQITDFIYRYEFDKCVEKYKGNYKIRTFTCWEQFLAMSFGQLTFRESLRDITVCLNSQKDKLYHLGFRSKVVARTTLARANENRNYRIYEEFAYILIKKARKLYEGDSEFKDEIDAPIYALDSSLIDVALSTFKWALYRKHRGAVKLHTMIDLRGSIPVFIHISHGKYHDVNVIDDYIELEPGAFYLIDRGYLSYKRLYKMHKTGSYFVTKTKNNTGFKRLYSNILSEEDRETGVRCDQIIKFTSPNAIKDYPEKLRRIKFYDKENDRYHEFITNNFEISAKLIADLYKARWRIELFFKWIKQHLRVKVFWGESKNAVKTQIWIAICTYVLVAIIKKEMKIKQSLYEILQILSVSPFDKIPLNKLFMTTKLQNIKTVSQKQLVLAGF